MISEFNENSVDPYKLLWSEKVSVNLFIHSLLVKYISSKTRITVLKKVVVPYDDIKNICMLRADLTSVNPFCTRDLNKNYGTSTYTNNNLNELTKNVQENVIIEEIKSTIKNMHKAGYDIKSMEPEFRKFKLQETFDLLEQHDLLKQ